MIYIEEVYGCISLFFVLICYFLVDLVYFGTVFVVGIV